MGLKVKIIESNYVKKEDIEDDLTRELKELKDCDIVCITQSSHVRSRYTVFYTEPYFFVEDGECHLK